MMRYFFILCFLFITHIAISQVVAEGDTVLCDGQQGEVGIILTATSYAVDLTDSNIYTDDIFGAVIDMEFDFEFYGNTYSEVVLSSNNYLSFNTGNAGAYSGWAINGAVPNNYDAPMNAILCPWQDIYPGVNGNGTIQYATTGEAPNRIFIASFCGIPMFSCTDICYSSQIKLFESTNIIETHIAQKVLCSSWNGGAAIHALHNEDGTIAHVVTGDDGIERNYPNEWTCENDGWQFTPNGTDDYILEEIEFAPAVAGTDIIWQDEFGNEIGTGGEIIVFPGGDVTYTAGASLCGDAGDWCGFEGGIEGDDVSITFESVNIIGTDVTNTPCDDENGGSAVVYLDGVEPYSYLWQNSLGEIISTFNNELLNIPADTYQFTVSTENGCEDTIEIFIDTDGNPVTIADAGEDIETCETSVVLSGTPPLPGETGIWTLLSGQGTISPNNSSETTISNLGFGLNTFSWGLQNECGSSADEITILLINGNPTILSPGSLYCLEQIPLIVDVENEEGQWSVSPSEGVYIEDESSINTFATVSEYGSYVFSFEGCNGVDFETINMLTSSPELSGPDEIYCLETFQLEAVVDGDFGDWTGVGPGNINFNNSTSLNPTVTVDNYGIYEFSYSGCGMTSNIIVDMVTPNPIINDPGIIYCNFEIEINANSSFPGLWSIGSIPTGQTINLDSNENSVGINVSDYGDYELVFSSCGVNDTIILTFATVDPYIIASDHQNCILTIDLYAMTPASNSGPWQQISGPSDADIIDQYSNFTQAIVSEFGLYEFSFTSCDAIDTIQIGVSCPMTVPNTFTPNGDGVNDIFQIPDLNPNVYTQSTLYVYNKWGAIVYIDPYYGLDGDWWDGKTTYHNKPFSNFIPERYYDNNSGYVNDGVYFYTLEVFNITKQQKEFYSGDVSIFSE